MAFAGVTLKSLASPEAARRSIPWQSGRVCSQARHAHIALSLSHTAEQAIAQVILESVDLPTGNPVIAGEACHSVRLAPYPAPPRCVRLERNRTRPSPKAHDRAMLAGTALAAFPPCCSNWPYPPVFGRAFLSFRFFRHFHRFTWPGRGRRLLTSRKKWLGRFGRGPWYCVFALVNALMFP